MLAVLDGIEFQLKKYDDVLILHPKETGTIPLPHIARQILESEIPAIINVIATEREICIQCEESFMGLVISRISKIEFERVDKKLTRYILPIHFTENPDTKYIEQQSKLTFEAYISKLLNTEFNVSMFGFVPGFLYMRGLNKELHVPRKSNPNTHIEAGSIAVGGPFLGLYSLNTPAGWNVVGKTPIRVLDMPNTPPILLTPGDTIQLKRIDADTFTVLQALSQNILEYND